MNSKKVRLILRILIALTVLIFLAILIVGSNMLSSKSKNMVKLKLQSHTLDTQLTSLAQAKKEVERYSYFNDIAKEVIPNDKDQAQAVLDIFQLANTSGITIQSITFPASTLGSGSGTPPAPPSGSSSSTNAATTPASKVISQAKPVPGISGLYSIELTIAPDTSTELPADKRITYPKLLDFLKRIENNRRTAQITQVTIQPLGSGGVPSQFINFNLTVNIFIKP